MLNLKELKEIKGDASFRKFYRNKKNHSIVVLAKKEKNKNLLIYDAINKILIKNKILAPKLLNHNYKDHLMEVEDFGDDTLIKVLKNKKTNKEIIFKKILKTLIKLQSIKDKHVINFKNQKYKVKEYDNKILCNEANLFSEWYAPRKINSYKMRSFEKKYKKEVKNLLLKLKFKNDTFVHRDFHISNLLYFKNNIAVIDSQDALIGNKAYDLASLVDDVRLKTSNKFKKKVLNYYLKKFKKDKTKKFINDFEILSVVRNLKIIGIFMRLAARDNKKKYKKMIPYAWQMINYRMKNNIEFKNLKSLMKGNFPKFIK
ncbi:phosphotransferase [Pelagibacterales bacterium SAG-MED22]|nr:phosphotransferase [Pelagibacterales bacterium SAG-MED22]